MRIAIFFFFPLFFVQNLYSQNFGKFGINPLEPAKDIELCLYGYKVAGKDWKIPPQFTDAKIFEDGYAIVLFQGAYGLIDEEGKFILDPIYENLCGPAREHTSNGDNYYAFRKGGKVGIIKYNGEIIFEGNYENIRISYFTKADIIHKGKYGYADISGNFIPPIYKKELNFIYGVAYFDTGKKRGYLNLKGETLITEEGKNKVYSFVQYGFIKKTKTGYGIYDIKGKALTSCDVDTVIQMNRHGIIYRRGGKYAVMNYQSINLSFGEYDYISPFNRKGKAVVIKNGKYGLIDSTGKIIIPPEYEMISDFGRDYRNWSDIFETYEKYSLVKKNNFWGLIDEEGKEIIQPKLEYASLEEDYGKYIIKCVYKDTLRLIEPKGLTYIPYDSLYYVDDDDNVLTFSIGKYGIVEHMRQLIDPKYGIARKDGHVIVKPEYEFIGGFNLGYAAFQKGEKWGLMDTLGKEIIKPHYDNLFHDWNSGDWYYAKSNNSKLGILNYKGEILADTIYTNICEYDRDGKCWMVQDQNKKWSIIDSTGKIIITGLDTTSVFSNQRAVVSKNKKFAVISNKGEIMDFWFDEILDLYNGFYLMKKDGKWGLMDAKMNALTSMTYDKMIPVQNGIGFGKYKNNWFAMDTSGKNYAEFTNILEKKDSLKLNYRLLFRENTDSLSTIKSSALQFIYDGKACDPFDVCFDDVYFDLLLEYPDKEMIQIVNNTILDSAMKYHQVYQNKPEVVTFILQRNLYNYKSIYYINGYKISNVTSHTVTINNFEFTGRHFDPDWKEQGGYIKSKYKNYMKGPAGLMTIKLASLFASQESYKILSSICFEDLKKIKDFEIDCTDPENLVNENSNFKISSQGLIFPFDDKSRTYYWGREVNVLIPYDKIKSMVNIEGPLKEFY